MEFNGRLEFSNMNISSGQAIAREADAWLKEYEEIQNNSGVLRIRGKIKKANLDEFEHMDDIGHGSCGHVSKMKYKPEGIVMAVKQMARTNNMNDNKCILRDLKVVSIVMDCPHIVLCYGYFITPTQVKVCMELMALCLDRLLKHKNNNNRPFPEKIIGKMSVSILKALHYLKDKHKIMHRDVKPSNILLDWNGNVKLCDFGISSLLIESRAHTQQAGCPPYMAPERFGEQEMDYDIRSDVWAVGISLVELAIGRYPYAGSEFEILSAILHNTPPRLTTAEGFSPEFCNLIEQCLQKDYEMRPRYPALLEHAFIKRSEEDVETDVAEWFSDLMAN